MEKKQFRVEITTKGSYEVEVTPIDTDEYDVNEITSDDFDDFRAFSDYICNCALGDEWTGPFEMKVFDENGNVVYESEDFGDFLFISDSEDIENDDLGFPSTIDPKKATEEWEKRWNEDGIGEEPGIYAVCPHEIKWLTFSFNVEDEEFDPSKLLFVTNRKLDGLVYDSMTDPFHVFYNDKFVDAEIDDDSYEEYGSENYIMEKCKEGWWKKIREVD